jgi:Leucine-rich repeat (LRR) protein
MNLIRKGSSELLKVGKSISITNKLLREIESRDVVPSDDYRVTIPDENFQKYLIKEYNLVFIDGTVAYGDIKEIKKISVSKASIESLEGVQYFTALSVLGCVNNRLTSLDVSKNTALLKLLCFNSQLTSLDVSKNTALTMLWCVKSQLTSLDVSKNTALTKLHCGDNKITSLDVSKNTSLTWLYCDSNQLTSLDLSNNVLLKKVSLNGNIGDWWKELEKDEE